MVDGDSSYGCQETKVLLSLLLLMLIQYWMMMMLELVVMVVRELVLVLVNISSLENIIITINAIGGGTALEKAIKVVIGL